jgi:tRNA pseudouridine13 synthase
VSVRWSPPSAEAELGLGFYATATPGTGGRLKVEPEDFRVDEISLYPFPESEGPYTILRVSARNWEQHELARRLSERIGLPRGRMAWAGTKDRRAITEQLLSYLGPPVDLGAEPLPGVQIREVYRAREGLVLGHHFGNAFDLRVREVTLAPEMLAERAGATLAALKELGRFPNLFGPQRFGEVRPVTHVVGRWLLRGDSRAAVEAYLTQLTEAESDEGRRAREAYAAHHDALRALREFPPAYRFERTLLDHLARGQEPARAFRSLPRELRLLFVHAYQSLLFNRYLGARRAEGLSFTNPEEGDYLLRTARDGTIPGTDAIPVRRDNLPEARTMVDRGRAVLAGPLVGRSTPEPLGRPGEILQKLLAEESVERAAFRLPAHPDIASEGTWRPLTVAVPPMGLRVDPPSPEEALSSYRLTFALPKGTYATVLLREFLKHDARPDETAGPEPSGVPSKQA